MVKNVAIAVLLVVIGVVLFRGCPGSEENRPIIDSLTAANLQLRVKFDSMQVQDSLIQIREAFVQDSLTRAAEGHRRTVVRLKRDTVVKYVRIAYPVVDTLLREQDTLAMTLQYQVDTLKAGRERAELRYKVRIDNKTTENNNLQGINSSLEAFNKSQSKTIRRQKVEVWIWRVVAGSGIAWGATRRK